MGNTQAELIHNEKWDVLVVLDACRYDIFREMYKEIFGDVGFLRKVISPATWTGAWVVEIFYEKPMPDVVFVSAHKWVNSKGPCDEKVRVFSERLKYGNRIRMFDSKKYFKNVVDVWKFGRNKELDTLPPNTMTEETIKTIESNPNCRVISKYYQLHPPYLYYLNRKDNGDKTENENIKKQRMGWDNLYNFINIFFNDETISIVREKVGFPPVSGQLALWLKYGREGVVKGYKEDLRLTLQYIKKIVDRFPDKKIIITSDHGERLGERGRYSHAGRRDRILKEVPWFEI